MLEFLGVSRSHHVKKLNKLLEQATEVVGGTLVQSPFFELLGQEITVHPIGYVTFRPVAPFVLPISEHGLIIDLQRSLHGSGQYW